MTNKPASSHGFDGSNQWAQYGGETILVSGVAGNLDWGGLISGAALLSLTSLTLPTVLVSGVYAVGVGVLFPAAAAGGVLVDVDVDLNGLDVRQTVSLPLHATVTQAITITVVSFCPAGGVLRVRASQSSGGDQTVDPAMSVQRVA